MMVLLLDLSFHLTLMEALIIIQAVRIRRSYQPSPGLLSSEWGSDTLPRTRAECAIHSTPSDMEPKDKVKPIELISSDFDLPFMSLFGKIWGDPIPFHLIQVKTKRDWTQVKRQVDYMDLGNAWLLIKFANVQDRDFVWNNHPWFVSGLNLVLRPWIPMFNPYTAPITHVDQWVTITRLPQEFWEETKLASLMSGVGVFLKVNESTLKWEKGKFARVFLNVYVTKPLRGTLTIHTSVAILHLPISYEGLHEVCAICGNTAHALEACHDSAKNVFEVVVEKFGATTLQPETVVTSPSSVPRTYALTETWVTVSPKKWSIPPSTHRKRGILSSPSCFSAPAALPVSKPTPSPAVVISDPTPSEEEAGICEVPPLQPPPHSSVPLASEFTLPFDQDSDLLLAEDDDMDLFLNLDGGDEPQHSSESSKKRRLEEEEDHSSSYTYL